MMSLKKFGWLSACGTATLALSMAIEARAEDQPPPQRFRILIDDGNPPQGGGVRGLFRAGPIGVRVEAGTPDVLFFAGEAGDEKPAKRYWIGLQCGAVPPAVQAQLGLADGKGLLVEEVVPDSPAAKAGIKPLDVIVAFGEKEIGNLEDLSAAVQGAEAKESSLTVIRGGAKQTFAVTPGEVPGPAGRERDAGEARRWVERFERRLPGPGVEDVLRFHLVQPGVRIEIGAPAELPEGYKVTITKEGKAPASVVVEKEGKSWTATEKTLDELPEEVRPWVRRWIGGPLAAPGIAGSAIQTHRRPAPPAVVIPGPHGWTKPLPGAPREPVEKRLEDTLRRLEELRRSVEELQKDLPKKPAEPPPPAKNETKI